MKPSVNLVAHYYIRCPFKCQSSVI